jgi:hypothetical protein
MQKETIIIIDLKGGKGLVALVGALTLMLLVLFLALPTEDGVVSASEMSVTQSAGMRQFYLSQDASQGDSALAQCAAGYHMASLWEIADPTNLKYNTSLGQTAADGGQGPPSDLLGWVRTGYQSDSSSTPGQANCTVWDALGGSGTVVNLLDYWTTGGFDVDVWNAVTAGCTLSRAVWCVED